MKNKVLIIEDNNDIRESTIEVLQMAGYTTFEAANGKAGFQLALTCKPDIILCDITMPELDGYGVLYMLNKHPEAGAIPFIFLTAKVEHIDFRKGMQMGADDYITKPFDDVELLSAIESRLKKKEIQMNFYSSSLDKLTTLISGNDGLKELKKNLIERRSRQIKKGQVIYYEGDKGNGIFLVLKGKVKTIKLAEDGRELMTGIYENDEYLGTNVLLSNENYSDTATALEDSVLCQLPKEPLEQLVHLHPEIGKEFIKLLAGNIRDKEDQLLQMAYYSVRKKMAEAILRLNRQKTVQSFGFKIAREDLAAMAGMAIETVSRTLSDFKDEGMIEKRGSVIQVLDAVRLSKIKN